MFASVVFPLPVDKPFSYAVPPHLETEVAIGKRLFCPLGKKKLIGFCISLSDKCEFSNIKEILAVLDKEPLINPSLLELAYWMSKRYLCPLGQVLDAMVPAPVKRSSGRMQKSASPAVSKQVLWEEAKKRSAKQAEALRYFAEHPEPLFLKDLKALGISPSAVQTLAKAGFLKIENRKVYDVEIPDIRWEEPRVTHLTEEQKVAVSTAVEKLKQGFSILLLQGVAGSGKTEVYIRTAEAAVKAGRKVIILVPEIALTPQTAGRFKQSFEKLALLHSRQTPAERAHEWRRITAGEVDVVVGARSAIFAPISPLGLIVIDEEQETSFKQENTPKYHAREVATQRAKQENALLLLGSATPDVSTYTSALNGEYTHLKLKERVRGGTPPSVVVADLLREKLTKKDKQTALPEEHSRSLIETISRGEQAILFINRRGYAPLAVCTNCRYILRCESCDTSLPYHFEKRRLFCHYCGKEYPLSRICSYCGHVSVRLFGFGTERVTEEVRQLLHDKYKIVRFDSDSMRTEEKYIETLNSFKNGEVSVLVGTQMVAKGLDFPNVTLVGVIYADWMLNFPDYRACERTFQLLLQASGRSGRALKPGKVIVQTLTPNHFVIEAAKKGDYETFARKELAERKRFNYPPFAKMVRIVFETPLQ
ncbi:MAG: primosomal protein N', partial [Planctomycetota bacterium]|nr:primosomal protein N' [Planctomycetota bacterium]